MRAPAIKPKPADTIDNVVTTARPNRISDAVLRADLRRAATRLAVDLDCMVPRPFGAKKPCNMNLAILFHAGGSVQARANVVKGGLTCQIFSGGRLPF